MPDFTISGVLSLLSVNGFVANVDEGEVEIWATVG